MINDLTGRMATELPTTTNGSALNGNADDKFTQKTGLARMLKGGVIMDVVNAEQVQISPPNVARQLTNAI
jgi:pyridoxal 5'-phosphate synthase pdxS subunit